MFLSDIIVPLLELTDKQARGILNHNIRNQLFILSINRERRDSKNSHLYGKCA